MEYHIAIDGGVEPNPGRNAAVGIVIKKKAPIGFIEVHKFGQKLKGDRDYTNNFVEWVAPYIALKWMVKNGLGDVDKIVFYSDSQLLVNQANGRFKINHEKSYAEAARITMEYLKEVKIPTEFIKIPRERNELADKLAGELIQTNSQNANMAF